MRLKWFGSLNPNCCDDYAMKLTTFLWESISSSICAPEVEGSGLVIEVVEEEDPVHRV
jgi:hypothetical protein